MVEPEEAAAIFEIKTWDIEAISLDIASLLNSGVSPRVISSTIIEKYPDEPIRLDYLASDLDYDTNDELFFFGTNLDVGFIGAYTCQAGEYINHLLIRVDRSRSISVELEPPKDLTEDGRLDVLFEYRYSGRGFCNLGYYLIGMNEGSIRVFLETRPLVACFEDHKISSAKDEEGTRRISIVGFPISTMSSGPTRETTFMYELNLSGNYDFVGEVLSPPKFRVHVLEEAQVALDEGDYDRALDLYFLAADSDELEMFITPDYPGDIELAKEYHEAFASFRIFTLLIALDDFESASFVYDSLLFSSNTASMQFADLAFSFIRNFRETESLAEACASLTLQINSEYPLLEDYLGHWGWSNIWYENETICPF